MTKKSYYFIGGVVVIFLLGFVIGREQMKYEIRSTITEGIKNVFGGDREKKDKIEEKLIQPWEFHTYGEGDKTIKVRVRKLVKVSQIQNGNWKKIISVSMEGENTGKKVNFKNINQFSVYLETKDGMQYQALETEQTPSNFLPAGFWGCVSCNSNPWEKNIELIHFEVPENLNLEWAKLKLDEEEAESFLLPQEKKVDFDSVQDKTQIR